MWVKSLRLIVGMFFQLFVSDDVKLYFNQFNHNDVITNGWTHRNSTQLNIFGEHVIWYRVLKFFLGWISPLLGCALQRSARAGRRAGRPVQISGALADILQAPLYHSLLPILYSLDSAIHRLFYIKSIISRLFYNFHPVFFDRSTQCCSNYEPSMLQAAPVSLFVRLWCSQ